MSADITPSAEPQSPLSALRAKHYPGQPFTRSVLRQAGRHLKRKGEDAAVAFLADKIAQYDARPPAKCQIVAQSRPFSVWPIAIVAHEVQEAVFQLRLEEYELLKPFKKTAACREFTLRRLGVDHQHLCAQALHLIIPHALNIYSGVLTKVENHNQKKAKHFQKANERRQEQGLDLEDMPEPKVATNADGYLLEAPGVNPNIYCYQQASPKAIVDTTGVPDVPTRFAHYKMDPSAPLNEVRPPLNRRAIPLGQYGHIPEWQRPFLNQKGKRRRAWYSHSNNKPKPNRRPGSIEREEARIHARDEGALLVLITIGSDWLLLDARGLLRSVVYRGLSRPSLSLDGLLDMFSGDPVIDPVRGIVTFLFKEGKVPIRKRKVTSMKQAPDLLKELTSTNEMIGLVSVDLGQTNPVAARVSRLRAGAKPELVSQLALPDDLIQEWARYRSACDRLEAQIDRVALDALPPEHKAEIDRANAYCPLEGRRLVAERLQVDPRDLPWEQMTGATHFCADLVLRDRPNDAELVHFFNTKKGMLKRTDYNIYRWTRPKAKTEAREALKEATWSLKKSSPDYARLSQRKRELSRRCINWLSREARRITHCTAIVVICEDLNLRFFHGSGKRDVGWDQFFVRKRENRWLIQALHRALTELAPHQGIPVVAVNPARTSITCPRCDLCNKASRDGEQFRCVRCGVKLHADFEVATANLERVALTGKSLPKAERERPGAAQKPVRARSRKRPAKVETKQAPVPPQEEIQSTAAAEKGAARKAVYRAA